MRMDERDLVIGVTPFGYCDTRLTLALIHSGALAVLDLGKNPDASRSAIAEICAHTSQPFGVRVTRRSGLAPQSVPSQVDTVIVEEPSLAGDWRGRRVLVEITSVDEARSAAARGASGIIAKGSESGGRIGQATTFVLLQQLVDQVPLPVWAMGGIGLHTASACLVGGASGVVIDSQLALVQESSLPPDVKSAISAMDGAETTMLAGYRVYTRPDLPVARMDRSIDPSGVSSRLGGSSLQELIAVGQEGAFAADLAKRFKTAGGVVQALRRSITSHMSSAVALRPLAPGSSFAADHGIRYPIAQGPMTRVSDRADFAAAVASAGALPFLALALMNANDVRTLLEETAEKLAGRPWGVGILGFVPQEIRSSQLQVVHDIRPPVALIAGGRPSQARPLEDAGIITYLHVPSPGLLDRFLKDGATHFVFEGRECGGHVGPRSSFALWESQIERLLASGSASKASVLFAGGIHDARSAAMVSALAAPLAEAGARVGVLMGTAYLFTEEAVSTGAILPGFQQAAISCKQTQLLETSPGHVTRCAQSPYVNKFTEEKNRLTSSGATPEETWAALESLNLGRLRLASKGLRRDGEDLVSVAPSEQRSEGMYMIGDAATLRRSVTTASKLHEDVSSRSAEILEAVSIPAPPTLHGDDAKQPAAKSTPVAIVGMASIFPGARDLDELWSNLVAGVDSITEVPAERWNVDAYYDPQATTTGAGSRTPSKWGGFLPAVFFDPLRYGIPPRSLGSIEPAQLLSLEVAARALADAGYADREIDRENTSVIFGAEAGTDLASAYGFRALLPEYLGSVPDWLDETLPKVTEDSFPGVLTNVISGRIANRLDFAGSNYTVDAACASSLAAVDLACKELASGHSSVVLCGGADLHNSINDFLLFSGVHALSPTGRCRSFDSSADGIALGEGIACVVLKRLSDATRDGDRIYAVIDGVGSSSDGRSLSLTAPRKEGQRLALERAYERSGISPSKVGLMEAHGTGTVVGDRTELATMTEMFTASGASTGSCVLGSIKSQIGHTKCAAGLAGLIKAALSLYHGVRPPTLHIEEPNSYYDPERSPFAFLKRSQPWVDTDRHAGVSAFGFGGTNFHVVLSAHDALEPPKHGLNVWPCELFIFRSEDLEGAMELMKRVERFATSVHPGETGWRFRDLARTVCTSGSGTVQVAIVAQDIDDLLGKLKTALSQLIGEGSTRSISNEAVQSPKGIFVAHRDASPGKIAFLFPGQGSQRPDMLADLFIAFPRLGRHLLQQERWREKMFPPAAFNPTQVVAQRNALTDTPVAQPCLGIADLAIAHLLSDLGIKVDLASGHSYGELVALCIAGAIDEGDLLALSEERGLAIIDAAGDEPGEMAAAGASCATVSEILEGFPDVVIANDNSPRQVVISGQSAALHSATEALAEAGIPVHRLPVACAFHSPVVASAQDRLRKYLGSLKISAPSFPVWSNATAGPYPDDPDAIRDLLASQVARGVRFTEQVLDMYNAGARTFIEVGPGYVLTHLVGKTLGTRRHVAVSSDSPREHGVTHLLKMLARLAVNGVHIDTDPLFEGRSNTVDLDAQPAAPPGWLVDGYLTRSADGSPIPNGLRPAPGNDASELGAQRLAQLGGATTSSALSDTRLALHSGAVASRTYSSTAASSKVTNMDELDATVIEFLRSMREVVATQREVMLTYLGGSRGTTYDRGTLDSAAPAATSAAASSPRAEAQREEMALTPTQNTLQIHSAAEIAATEIGPTIKPTNAGREETAPKALDAAYLLDTLVQIVSDRTGYPADMLEPDLDLEADLSIDSIKRMEILGELADRLPLPGSSDGQVSDDLIEELVQIKNLRGIADWLEARSQEVPTEAEPGALPQGTVAETLQPHTIPEKTLRFVPYIEVLADDPYEADRSVLAERRFVIVDDARGIATELAARLDKVGAIAEVVNATAVAALRSAGTSHVRTPVDFEEADGLIYLSALSTRDHNSPEGHSASPAHAEDLFVLARQFLTTARHPRWLVAATGFGGTFSMPEQQTPLLAGSAVSLPDSAERPSSAAASLQGSLSTTALPEGAGIPGLMRTIAREYPQVVARTVDVDNFSSQADIAEDILCDLISRAPTPDVGHQGGRRTRTRFQRAALPSLPTSERGIELGPESVVVITGGARGITSLVAVELARRYGCQLELLGRSPLPEGDEDPVTKDASSLAEVRKALISSGLRDHSEVEATASSVLRARDIRRTLAKIDATGAEANYHPVDVRDASALQNVIEDIYSRHGRIDGVIHGAGAIEDKLIADKTPDSFARVFSTKVQGAINLIRPLRSDVSFIVFFTSIAGAFGNRGQADYAAANDALVALARSLQRQTSGRVIAIDWGPWAGTGMVSAELEREYAKRSIGLIPQAEGIQMLLNELSHRAQDDVEVLVMRAEPEHFEFT